MNDTLTLEPCPFCGHRPTVNAKAKLVKCCKVPYIPIDTWTLISKAVRHYEHCDNRDEVKTTGAEVFL